MLTFAYWTSPQDWLIVGVVVMVLFGGRSIPEFAKGVGEGMREFRRAMDGSAGKETPEPEPPRGIAVESVQAKEAPESTAPHA